MPTLVLFCCYALDTRNYRHFRFRCLFGSLGKGGGVKQGTGGSEKRGGGRHTPSRHVPEIFLNSFPQYPHQTHGNSRLLQINEYSSGYVAHRCSYVW